VMHGQSLAYLTELKQYSRSYQAYFRTFLQDDWYCKNRKTTSL